MGRQKNRKDISISDRKKLEVLKQFGYDDDYSRAVEEEKTWNKYFNQLVEYKRVVGRKAVAKKDYPKLLEWVARQRKMKKRGNMSEPRKKLVDLGFVFRRNKPYAKKKRFFEKQEKKWNEMYERLREYNEHHGNCIVRYNDEQNQNLAIWVSAQRAEFVKGSIDDTRKRRLDELNFTWTFIERREPLG